MNRAQLYERGKGKGKYNGLSNYCVLTVHWEFHKGHSSPLAAVATNSTPSRTQADN